MLYVYNDSNLDNFKHRRKKIQLLLINVNKIYRQMFVCLNIGIYLYCNQIKRV